MRPDAAAAIKVMREAASVSVPPRLAVWDNCGWVTPQPTLCRASWSPQPGFESAYALAATPLAAVDELEAKLRAAGVL